MKNKLKGFKKAMLGFISVFALLTIGWLIFFGKGKVLGLISPLIEKIPKDENKLTEFTSNVLGKAVEQLNKDNFKKAAEKGNDLLENTQYGEPVREIRETVIRRVDEVIESIKELPAQEVKIIKREVCKQWFEEQTATNSAGN